jgi:hypothetical protein
MLKRSEIVALSRKATKRVQARKTGLAPMSAKHRDRFLELKRGKGELEKAVRAYRRAVAKIA